LVCKRARGGDPDTRIIVREGGASGLGEARRVTRREGEDGRRLSTSYVSFYIANGGVIMPSFEDGKDAAARDTVTACFPEHQVRQVPALDIVRGGGGIHCITQQQPMALPEAEAEEAADSPEARPPPVITAWSW